jgi:predicted transcriptional regulator
MSTSIKEKARRLVESLPDDSTWEDLMYKIYVRETIKSGLADSEAGRVTDVEKVREELGLPIKQHFAKPLAKRLHKDP